MREAELGPFKYSWFNQTHCQAQTITVIDFPVKLMQVHFRLQSHPALVLNMYWSLLKPKWILSKSATVTNNRQIHLNLKSWNIFPSYIFYEHIPNCPPTRITWLVRTRTRVCKGILLQLKQSVFYFKPGLEQNVVRERRGWNKWWLESGCKSRNRTAISWIHKTWHVQLLFNWLKYQKTIWFNLSNNGRLTQGLKCQWCTILIRILHCTEHCCIDSPVVTTSATAVMPKLCKAKQITFVALCLENRADRWCEKEGGGGTRDEFEVTDETHFGNK